MTVIDYEIVPDPIVLASSMFTVAAAFENKVVPLAESGEIIRQSIEERFETETDPSGTRWDEWAESYEPIAAAYPNEAILTQSGDLREAATAEENIVVSNDAVFYNMALLPHYGLAHDAGLPDRQRPLPQREFLGLTDEAAAVITGVFYEWFEGNLDLYPTSTGRLGMRHKIRAVPGGFFISRAAAGLGPL